MPTMRDGRLLLTACICFAMVGLVVAIAGTSTLFGPWHAGLAEALFGRHALGEDLNAPLELLLGILGGSIFGKWLATAAVVRFGGQWAKPATWFALLSWFVIDSWVSAIHGAWFNIWMINLGPLIFVGVLLILWTPRGSRRDRRHTRGDAVLIAILAIMSLTGLGFAVGAIAWVSPWLDGWHALVANEADADRLLAFLGGPIGGTVFAHFGLLAWAAWARPADSWVSMAVVGSVGGWFVVDATCSLLAGASFNVLLIDLPCLLLVLGALGARAALNRSTDSTDSPDSPSSADAA